MLAIIKRLRSRAQKNADLGDGQSSSDNDQTEFSNVPPPVSAEGLLRRIPVDGERILVLKIEKADCSGNWHKRRAILTSKSIIFARDEDEYIREEIELKLMEGVQLLQDPESQKNPERDSRGQLAKPDYIDLRSKHLGREDITPATSPKSTGIVGKSFTDLFGNCETGDMRPKFDIFARIEGLDSVVRYTLRTKSKKDMEQLLRALQQARDSLLRTLPGVTAVSRIQEKLSIIYDRYTSFGIMATLIFSNFVIDIAQAELQPEPGTGAAAAFRLFEILYTALFSLDLLINLLAHWPHPFLSKGWNLIDVVVISLSVASLSLDSTNGFTCFRTIRAIRAVRLLKGVSRLREIVNAIISSVGRDRTPRHAPRSSDRTAINLATHLPKLLGRPSLLPFHPKVHSLQTRAARHGWEISQISVGSG